MQQYVDKIKKFLVEYKRYFGAAALFFILVVVLVKCTAPDEQQPQKEETQKGGTEVTEPDTSTEPVGNMEGELEKNASEEIVSLIQNYYTAYASADVETLEMIASPITDNEISYIGTFADYYEEYQNIECYSMPVGTEEAYFVSVCYDLKFYEVDTPAPGMDFFYVERNGKGNLCVNNAYTTYNFNFMEQELDQNIYAMIIAYEQKDEVVALQKSVQAKYDEAVASDEKLANLIGGTLRNAMSQWRDMVNSVNDAQDTEQSTEPEQPDTQNTEETEQTTDGEADSQENSDDGAQDEPQKPEDEKQEDEKPEDSTFTVKTKDICNVRAKASTDAELLGRVDINVKLTALGREGDWIKVEFQGGTGYIRSDLVKKVKK